MSCKMIWRAARAQCKKNGDLDLVVAFYFRNIIMKLPELQLTNQNKRRYHFRFNSVNQLFAILTSVAPNWRERELFKTTPKYRKPSGCLG